jgi:hypothetical protein
VTDSQHSSVGRPPPVSMRTTGLVLTLPSVSMVANAKPSPTAYPMMKGVVAAVQEEWEPWRSCSTVLEQRLA